MLTMRTIRFFPDHTDTVLWDSSADDCAVYPADIGLSHALTGQLTAWNEHWENNHDDDIEWLSEAARLKSKKWGDEVLAKLRTELSGKANIVDRRYD